MSRMSIQLHLLINIIITIIKMKKLLVIVLSTCLILMGFAAEAFDFRQTNWGMSREQVKVTEKSEFVDWDVEIIDPAEFLSAWVVYLSGLFLVLNESIWK